MLVLRLEYLTARAVATAYNDRGAAEWPPHPARVFSALVATWAEQDLRGCPDADAERAALEWLEKQGPPALAFEEGCARTVMTHFVPVNDVTLLPSRLGALADKQREARVELAAAEEELTASGSGRTKAAKRVEKARNVLRRLETQYHKACSAAFAAATASASADERRRALALLPEGRRRQPRTFPSLALPDPVVHLSWSCDVDPIHRPALDRLAARLVRIGHSSSFVHARWVEQSPPPNWVPDDQGELLLRVVGPGQFARLSEEHTRHQGVEPRVLPFRTQRYRSSADIPAVQAERALHFGARDWIILKRVGGASLPLTRTVDLAIAVRGALMRHADQPVHELISGHASDGSPSRKPHLAILSLPNVGHRRSDGAIKGVALLLPSNLDDASRRPVLRALGRWEAHSRAESGEHDEDAPTLTLGLRDGVVLEVQRQVWGDPGLAALRERTWCETSTEWMSVTPVALDRNPGDLRHADPVKRNAAFRSAAESIAAACRNVGLPQPEAVTVLPSGTWPGGAKAAQFPVYPSDPGKLKRVKVHARIRFAAPVQGPLLIGAGRFQGLGLFRPVMHGGT